MSYLQDMDEGLTIRTHVTPIDLNMFQPLDVCLEVAVDLALELHITAHHCGPIGW